MQIFILIFWVASGGHIVDVEEIGIAPTAQVCRNVTMEEVKNHTADFDSEVAKGLKPHVVCGISPEAQKDQPKQKLSRDCDQERALLEPETCGDDV